MLDTGTLNHSPIKNSSRLLDGKSYSFSNCFFLFFCCFLVLSTDFQSDSSLNLELTSSPKLEMVTIATIFALLLEPASC